MILSYFDENKFSIDRPMFYIGGFMVPDSKLSEVEEILTVIVRIFFGISLLTKENEEDEYAKAISDFSSFKGAGRTPMYRGRSLEPLKDTIYYTRSHHSRFLQLADLIVFLAQRFDMTRSKPEKWIDTQGWNFWQTLTQETDCQIKRWP
ncbi:MAG: DUF3800 domain-containing protein [Verrucomicrobia bacterium]|nr:DUF3800 domain-containing protein [Verrucomicrobiota bacterium]